MPKKVRVSLKGIVREIDKATKGLSGAKVKAATAMEKKRLAVKIQNLKKIKKNVEIVCLPVPGVPGLNIVVNTK